MGRGRGSAGAAAAALLGASLLCLLAHSEAAVYTVGDAAGWTFGDSSWPSGKQFSAGDQLVFKYDPAMHNVAIVDAAGFDGCQTSPGSQMFFSGNDVITLGQGTTYFICTFPGHCQNGMKIAVLATFSSDFFFIVVNLPVSILVQQNGNSIAAVEKDVLSPISDSIIMAGVTSMAHVRFLVPTFIDPSTIFFVKLVTP